MLSFLLNYLRLSPFVKSNDTKLNISRILLLTLGPYPASISVADKLVVTCVSILLCT